MFAAFLDACALVPASLADTLLGAAERGLFRPLWSNEVLDEAERAVMRVHPDLAPSRVRRRFRVMGEAFPDAGVTGYEAMTSGLELPDPDDRHVAAAAAMGRADVLVTFNVRDFPTAAMPEGVEVVHPDDFLLAQVDLYEVECIDLVRQQAAAMRHPPMDVHDVLISLGRAGVPGFARAVSPLLDSRGGS
ncbi:PIN domain-containing protein [Litorihabitans aurantiacus]|uniref:PIN domain-containing protein n=1 Tax=Litorihabitans aurantiacus TaxID=1930061 RepID=A0AA38CST4_9MICO|nr:PIN domain-containing protein [Litorihabitans aurantiacus]GMA32531.1 PIN domain-containing protein [Litorihabitans aurantiacus]